MAMTFDKGTVKNGRLIEVWNSKRKNFSNANTSYLAVWVEDADGKNERCLLFTHNEIKKATDRAEKNKEDLTEKKFLIDILD